MIWSTVNSVIGETALCSNDRSSPFPFSGMVRDAVDALGIVADRSATTGGAVGDPSPQRCRIRTARVVSFKSKRKRQLTN